MIPLMWNLKYDTNDFINETEIDIENRLVVAKERRVEGGLEEDLGISRYKLVRIEWINNKVLLYST